MEKKKTLVIMTVYPIWSKTISVTDEQLKFLKWLASENYLRDDLFIEYDASVEEDFNE